MSEMKDELEQQIEEAEASDDAIRGIKYTMRMRATIIASSTLFEMLILMLIILNGVLLGVQTYEKFGPLTNQALDATQRVCLSIFTFEVVLKVYAFGLYQYFSDGWNVFTLNKPGDGVVIGVG